MQVSNRAPKSCPNAPQLAGEHAEVLARTSASTARDNAREVLKTDAKNPYAELALAYVSLNQDNLMGETIAHAQKALDFGRGAEAERLLGRGTMARSMFQEAAGHFTRLLATNPNDTEASFSLAYCAQKLGNYRAAREALLQTLRADPKHKRARIALIHLAHSIGANAEAQHHLAKLAEIVRKDDPDLVELTQLLNGTASDAGPDAGPASKGAPLIQVTQQKH